MRVSKKQLNSLWILTGCIVALLVAATIFTAVKAAQVRKAGFDGYITGNNSAIYLRERPYGSAAIVTILELGMPVRVTDSATRNNINWYHVEFGTTVGWIPANRVTTEPP